MIDSVSPYRKALSAEPAATVDVDNYRLPIIHEWSHLAIVHQPKMLPQVILAVECSSIEAFVFALSVVMRFNMIVCRVLIVAIDA